MLQWWRVTLNSYPYVLFSSTFIYGSTSEFQIIIIIIIIIISPLFTSFEGDKPDPPGNISMGGTAKRKWKNKNKNK